MPRAAVHTAPLLVPSQTSSRAAHPRQYLRLSGPVGASRRVSCVELKQHEKEFRPISEGRLKIPELDAAVRSGADWPG